MNFWHFSRVHVVFDKTFGRQSSKLVAMVAVEERHSISSLSWQKSLLQRGILGCPSFWVGLEEKYPLLSYELKYYKWYVLLVIESLFYHQNLPDALFLWSLEEFCKDENDIHTSTGNCFLIVLAKYDSCYIVKNMKFYTFNNQLKGKKSIILSMLFTICKFVE